MDDIEEKKEIYKKILETRSKNFEEIKKLEEINGVIEYLRLNEENKNLYIMQKKLYEEIKIHDYESCDHILVVSHVSLENGYGARRCDYKGCIKCGCDEYVKEKSNLSIDEKIMLKYLRSLQFNELSGKQYKIYCERGHDIFTKAVDEYKKLKNINDDLDEDSILDMLKVYVENENKKLFQRRKIRIY